jgi:hypothetical protein
MILQGKRAPSQSSAGAQVNELDQGYSKLTDLLYDRVILLFRLRFLHERSS